MAPRTDRETELLELKWAEGQKATNRRDPTDDAAWPLPEGWTWTPSRHPTAASLNRFSGAYIVTETSGTPKRDQPGVLLGVGFWGIAPIPFAVIDVLRARWEAGQA